jgi:hypothetical protein
VALPDLSITLAGHHSITTLEDVIKRLEPIYALSIPAVVWIDLRKLLSITAAPLALLVAALKSIDDQNLVLPGSIYRHPRHRPTREYLASMRFERLLLEASEPQANGLPPGFQPCHTFTVERDLDQIVTSLARAVSEGCLVDDLAKRAIWFTLNEVAQNVVHHASATSGGVAAASIDSDAKQFELAIADCGVGVRSSLSRNVTYAELHDDAEALEAALRVGVTSNPDGNTGLGLAIGTFLARLNGGSLFMRSGTAMVQAGHTYRITKELTSLPGSLVAVRLRTDQPLDLAPVMARLQASTTV